MKSKYTGLVVVLVMSLFACNVCMADDRQSEFGGCEDCHPEVTSNFSTSLHYTGAGMMNEYAMGAAGHFEIDMDEYYKKWNCSKCHVTSCQQCHFGYTASSGWGHREQTEITIQTCDPCHKKKQTATYVGDMPGHKKKAPHADIHYEKGLICIDCHTSEDLHGTGVMHDTQLAAVSVKCEDCHISPDKVVKGMQVTQYSSETYSHELHGDKLACIACHTGWSLTCNGCHIDTRKGTKPVSDEFYLGRNVDGQITTFIKMDATYNNKTHTGYGEWFSHTVTNESKECAFCHENEKVLLAGCVGQIIGEGGSLIDDETVKRVLKLGYSQDGKPVLDTTIAENTIIGFAGIVALMILGIVYLKLKRR